MTPELVIADMLNDLTLTTLIGDRLACAVLPQNTNYPALVYQVISCVPQPHININEPQRVQARIQINPIATSIAQVKQIHAAVQTLLAWQRNISAAGNHVVVCRPDNLGSLDKDEELGLWTQPADYLILYYQ